MLLLLCINNIRKVLSKDASGECFGRMFRKMLWERLREMLEGYIASQANFSKVLFEYYQYTITITLIFDNEKLCILLKYNVYKYENY